MCEGNPKLREINWKPLLPAAVCFIVLVAISLLIPPAAADGLLNIVPPTYNSPHVNFTPWDAETGYYTRYWFNYETGDWLPYGFLQSIMMPFTDLMGYWVFVIMWGVYLFGVWNRERGIELTIVIMLISGPLWGLLLPPETFSFLYLCMVMGIAAIIYRLYKKGAL